MTIKEFIEAAIEGGYINTSEYNQKGKDYMVKLFSERIEKVVLDPNSWKAVGNTMQWKKDSWKDYMIMMVGDLINGKTLEEYIATL